MNSHLAEAVHAQNAHADAQTELTGVQPHHGIVYSLSRNGDCCIYVGSTLQSNPRNRFKTHRSCVVGDRRRSQKVYKHISAHGGFVTPPRNGGSIAPTDASFGMTALANVRVHGPRKNNPQLEALERGFIEALAPQLNTFVVGRGAGERGANGRRQITCACGATGAARHRTRHERSKHHQLHISQN
jgi:hypothetical protein